MLLRLFPVFTATLFRPLFLVILKLLVLSNPDHQIKEIGKMMTLEMNANLEVDFVERHFRKFGLRYLNETSVPLRLEAVEVLLNRFSSVLSIRCYIGN